MRPTLAFVAGQLSGGGAERQLLYLLRGLAAYPVRVTLASLRPGDPGQAAFESLGVPVHVIPSSRWKVDRLYHLAAWLRRERPVLVHSWTFFANPYAAWAGKLAGVPVRLGSLRGDVFYENTVEWQAPPLFMRLGLQAPQAVVVNSAAAAEALAQRGPRGVRTVVVRNGLDLNALRSAALDDGATGGSDKVNGATQSSLVAPSPCRPVAPSPHPPVLVLVGNLIPRKNAPMFLRVVAGLARSHPGTEGWLVGDGPERGALEALARELGVADQVRFLGRRADVPRLVAQADLLCHCSHSEGLSNAIMEASALGVPVVATRAGGTDEIVEDGVTGLLVDADDSEAMTRAASSLLAEPERRSQMAAAGRRKMETEFSLDRMVGNMLSVYHEAMARRNLALNGLITSNE